MMFGFSQSGGALTLPRLVSLLAITSAMLPSVEAAPYGAPVAVSNPLWERKDTSMVKQKKASQELVMFATPEDTSIKKMKGQYVYDRSAGEGIDVYIIDSGAELTHEVLIFAMPFLQVFIGTNLLLGIHDWRKCRKPRSMDLHQPRQG
jgi:hypothetical protein